MKKRILFGDVHAEPPFSEGDCSLCKVSSKKLMFSFCSPCLNSLGHHHTADDVFENKTLPPTKAVRLNYNKDIYEELLTVTVPVLIDVRYHNPESLGDRFRILYPDGRCEYARTSLSPVEFTVSCFATKPEHSLERTVLSMKNFDQENRLEPVGFVPIED